jgi:hypothetical protein
VMVAGGRGTHEAIHGIVGRQPADVRLMQRAEKEILAGEKLVQPTLTAREDNDELLLKATCVGAFLTLP